LPETRRIYYTAKNFGPSFKVSETNVELLEQIAAVERLSGLEATVRFNELVRLLEQNGFRLIREKGSIRYYSKPGVDRLIRVDYHGAKEIPTGTCNAILKAAGLKGR
jgi:predicted RNA binding protein YcfA (HicA-like mRNA interferase family)